MNRIRITIISLLAAAAMIAVSCEKNDVSDKEVTQLEVNAHTVSGKWKLMEWNGSGLTEGTYMYIDIVRNDKTYTMYQNMDSFTDVPHIVTGSYYLYTDLELGALIRGNYDYDGGDWAHRYIIKSLTENDMLWVAKDDSSFTQYFVRVESIPVER